MERNHDVFISHSSADSKLAYAICDYLEERGIPCWIAPRDVQGGVEYAESIIMGIRACKIMIVVFNENANKSLFVKNEVERAFNYNSIIMPFKVDDTIPSASLELFLGSVHWLNAATGSAEDYFDLLYQNCARSLGIHAPQPVKARPVINTAEKGITIGSQTWMPKNLDVDKFRNGDLIPEAKSIEDWLRACDNRQPVWCYYDFEPKNGVVYGKIYNWYAVIDSRGLAPQGWHIPTADEWNTLIETLGGANEAGKALMSKTGWDPDKVKKGTDSSGFAGLPGGRLNGSHGVGEFEFNSVTEAVFWWSSSEYESEYDKDNTCDTALVAGLFSDASSGVIPSYKFCEGSYVRCLSGNASTGASYKQTKLVNFTVIYDVEKIKRHFAAASNSFVTESEALKNKSLKFIRQFCNDAICCHFEHLEHLIPLVFFDNDTSFWKSYKKGFLLLCNQDLKQLYLIVTTDGTNKYLWCLDKYVGRSYEPMLGFNKAGCSYFINNVSLNPLNGYLQIKRENLEDFQDLLETHKEEWHPPLSVYYKLPEEAANLLCGLINDLDNYSHKKY